MRWPGWLEVCRSRCGLAFYTFWIPSGATMLCGLLLSGPTRGWVALFGRGISRDFHTKKPRPWFSCLHLPRSSIILVARLCAGHISTGDHFERMRQDPDPGCSCSVLVRDLEHIIHICPLTADSRPRAGGHRGAGQTLRTQRPCFVVCLLHDLSTRLFEKFRMAFRI